MQRPVPIEKSAISTFTIIRPNVGLFLSYKKESKNTLVFHLVNKDQLLVRRAPGSIPQLAEWQRCWPC